MRQAKSLERCKVFISSSDVDMVSARKMRNLLSQRTDFQVFTAEDLQVDEWEAKLRRFLTEADVVLTLLTPSSVTSKWVLHEIGAAWVLGKRIIPVISRRDVLNRIPVSLDDTQAIELPDLDLDGPGNADRFVSAFDSLAMAHAA